MSIQGQVVPFPKLPVHTDEADIAHFLSHGLNMTPEEARDFMEKFRIWLAATDAEWDQDQTIEVEVDVLLRLQEMANKLIRIMDDDTHVLRVEIDGYDMQHPISCRPDLLGCLTWAAYTPIAQGDSNHPLRKPGRYVVRLDDSGKIYGHKVRS